VAAAFVLMYTYTFAQSASVTFEAQTRVFRMEGGNVSYAFGINDANELQPLYWGARLSAGDPLGPAHRNQGHASFDLPSGSTLQEFPGWGEGLYYEPALKITFPDGNRDLVLHYVDHAIDGNQLKVRLKDIEREVYVELQYQIDPKTGILARSAVITNKTSAPLMIEEAAAASWSLPNSKQRLLALLFDGPVGG
jgi:alpha-galactosidase